MTLPRVDVSLLLGGAGDDHPAVIALAAEIDDACRNVGFFTVVGHAVDPALLARLDAAARSFFARPESEKAAIAMTRSGRAWRGWFPLGGELTSGVPDHKEGLYFGVDAQPDDPRWQAGAPLHGLNLWPDEPASLRTAVEEWMAAMTALARALVRAMGIGLGLGGDWFDRNLTADPTVLFRIFRYPPVPTEDGAWGVGEHTDYGLLTLLAQDQLGGLQVRVGDSWIDVLAEPGVIVVNLGDMLDRMTEGRYRSTPHRVRPTTGELDRLSFPFFFDPGWEASVAALPLAGEARPDDAATRWDGTSLRHLGGTYGEYLTAKVAKVFPGLAD